MTMQRILAGLLFFLFLFPDHPLAQRKGDLKIDLVSLAGKEVELVYEWGFGYRNSIEFVGGYEFGEVIVIDRMGRRVGAFDDHSMKFELRYRWYLGLKEGYTFEGFSFAPLLGYVVDFEPDPDYLYAYREIHGSDPADTKKSIYGGLSGSYKYRYNRWMIEGGLTAIWGGEKFYFELDNRTASTFYMDMAINVRLGYLLFDS